MKKDNKLRKFKPKEWNTLSDGPHSYNISVHLNNIINTYGEGTLESTLKLFGYVKANQVRKSKADI